MAIGQKTPGYWRVASVFNKLIADFLWTNCCSRLLLEVPALGLDYTIVEVIANVNMFYETPNRVRELQKLGVSSYLTGCLFRKTGTQHDELPWFSSGPLCGQLSAEELCLVSRLEFECLSTIYTREVNIYDRPERGSLLYRPVKCLCQMLCLDVKAAAIRVLNNYWTHF